MKRTIAAARAAAFDAGLYAEAHTCLRAAAARRCLEPVAER
jgi:hypothetical protein